MSEIRLPVPGVLQLALTPDGRIGFVSMDNRINAYLISNGKLLAEIEVPIKGVYGLAVSPDGSALSNAGADGRIRTLEIDKMIQRPS